MNIFFLDKDPHKAAKMHCDKHTVKMILESAQLLSTAHRVLDGELINKKWILKDNRENALYKATHANHPSAIWTRSNINHYMYLYRLFCELMEEYTYRYGKVHKCDSMREILSNAPTNIVKTNNWQDPPQCMPDDSKVDGDVVEAYRNYYTNHKARFAKWTRRKEPSWWNVKIA